MLLVLLKHSNKSKALMPGIVHIDLIIKNMYFLFTPICYRRRLKNCSAFVKWWPITKLHGVKWLLGEQWFSFLIACKSEPLININPGRWPWKIQVNLSSSLSVLHTHRWRAHADYFSNLYIRFQGLAVYPVTHTFYSVQGDVMFQNL